MNGGRLSIISGYQTNAASPLEGPATYKSGRSSAQIDRSCPSSWGTDTASISSAAMEKLKNEGAPRPVEREAFESRESGAAAACTLTVGGKVKDIAGTLEAIAAEDFGKFLELMDKLKSGDPATMLDALAEICGEPRAEVQEAIAGMGDAELAQFATGLSKITGQPASDIMQSLREIQEHHEYADWTSGQIAENAAKSKAAWQPGELNSRLYAQTPYW